MRAHITAAMAAAAIVVTACGGALASAGGEEQVGAPVAGVCAPEAPDCVDTVVDPDGDDFDSDAARAQAEELLGASEDELDPEVRIARRGGEMFMLTEDYVVGRFTVELDADGEGTYRVASVTVELPEGPETFRR